ncbi:MAG: DUF308 domain-containing protein [Methanobacteriaceae archaeon]|nr:DUF308 domain-containing protein [Methanobacteriaceae archaeon]
MQKTGSALILIILGLIVLLFPPIGVIPLSIITGFIILFLGIGLLMGGIIEIGESIVLGIVEIALGIIALILGIGFIFNPAMFSFLVALSVYIIGLFLIISGIAAVITKAGGSRWNGILAVIIGFLYIVIGVFLANPMYLGILIGLWLLITGIIMLFEKE